MSPHVSPVTAMYRPVPYSSTEPPPTVMRLPCGSSPYPHTCSPSPDTDTSTHVEPHGVEDAARPTGDRALGVEAVIEVEAHDAVAVEDEPRAWLPTVDRAAARYVDQDSGAVLLAAAPSTASGTFAEVRRTHRGSTVSSAGIVRAAR